MPVTSVALPHDTALYEDDAAISHDELTALALAADPSVPLSTDATPLDIGGGGGMEFLPGWYMPPVLRSSSRRWHRWAIIAVIVAFLAIDAFGLCSTYGPLTAA
jgi:hypothetical protein